MQSAIASKRSLSFEFFPPKSPEGLRDFTSAVHKCSALPTSFISITRSQSGTPKDTLDLAKRASTFGVDVVVHLTCHGSSLEDTKSTLGEMRDSGLFRVMALRGDGIPCLSDCAFPYASGLVNFIKSNFPEISVAVAGYPECHPEAVFLLEDIRRLKEKVDAGASMIVTQMVFEPNVYESFVGHCRSVGISVPIIPGVMPITSVKQLDLFSSRCGVVVPARIKRELARISDPEAVVEYGSALAVRLCKDLLECGAPGVHFYSLNKTVAYHVARESLLREPELWGSNEKETKHCT